MNPRTAFKDTLQKDFRKYRNLQIDQRVTPSYGGVADFIVVARFLT